ncbi:hypothetical protein RhiirA1_404387, partial [Rhizophagus irregularis]
SSKKVAKAFKSIYDNPDKPLNWPRKLQCDKGTEFMGYVTLLMDEHDVKIRRIIARFRHTSFAMIDRYAGLFEYRVFKNQYLIEFLLPTGKRCRECVDEPQLPKGTTIRFLLAPGEWENDPFERRRITDPIWSSSLHKIQRIVVGKNPPMPILYYLDESESQRPFVKEQLMHIKEEPMLPSRWVLGDN